MVGVSLDRAFYHDEVTLIHAYVSKNMLPAPPPTTVHCADNRAATFLEGDLNGLTVICDFSEKFIRVTGALHLGRSTGKN